MSSEGGGTSLDPGAALEALFRLHAGLPRQAPGAAESTARALRAVAGLPPSPRILDLGCGPGAQTADLARLTAGTIVAVDLHPPFLAELLRRTRAGSRAPDGALSRASVGALQADMNRLPFAPASFDLLWAEGAVYVAGFDRGLALWRPLLRPGGHVAVTELTWLRPDPPEEARRFWDAGYPEMRSAPENLAALAGLGFEPLEHFALPESAWWEEYYAPLEERVGAIEADPAADPALAAVAAATREEIELYRASPDSYGYVFYVARSSG